MVLIGLLCLLAVFFVLRARFMHPTLIGQAHAPVKEAMRSGGSWYWLEGVGKPGARLMRASASSLQPIAASDGLGSYAVAEGKVVWAAREGDHWSLTLASADGSGQQKVWSGPREPHGLYLTVDHIYWLDQLPPTVPDSGPLPPLGPTLQLVAVPVSGGASTIIATLLEPLAGRVIGIHGDQIYVSAMRPGAPGVTTLYRIALLHGAPKRVAGETGLQSSILTQDGALYWSAPSRESSQFDRVVCIRRLGKDDQPETLTDWMEGRGRLYETERGVCYVDGDVSPKAWLLTVRKELPRALPLPENYAVLAAGDRELLLVALGTDSIMVYQVGMP